jgi:hypothetical protein
MVDFLVLTWRSREGIVPTKCATNRRKANEEREQEQFKEEKTSMCPMMDDRNCKKQTALVCFCYYPTLSTPLRRAEKIGGATARPLSQQI